MNQIKATPMQVFIYSYFNEDQRTYLRQQMPLGFTPVFQNELPENEVTTAFADAQIIMGNPPAAWFDTVPAQLTFWQLDSAGFDQYRQVNIPATVANMGDFYARPCAETMIGGLLAFYRGLPALVKAQTQKQWQGRQLRAGLDLLGNKNILILGAGAIGQACKQMLAGFGCPVKMSARTNPAADLHAIEEVLAALPATDVVVNTLPGGAEKYVSADFIQAMKPGSVYASVGRGSTTDEQALIEALQTGHLAGAVLDVTEQEPLPVTSPLWEMENVFLTQHSGGGYILEDEGKIELFLANLHRLHNGEAILNQVDLARGY